MAVADKDYIDAKFEGLEKFLESKLESFSTHERRISCLENWKFSTVGACVGISFVIGIGMKLLLRV